MYSLINIDQIQLLKDLLIYFGCIPVSENEPSGATKKIQEYIDKKDYTYKLAIAPEAGKRLDKDNTVLAKFLSGALFQWYLYNL
jgi:hypothetical protein